MFAAARLGATIVMISTAWREREVEHALRSPNRRTSSLTARARPTSPSCVTDRAGARRSTALSDGARHRPVAVGRGRSRRSRGDGLQLGDDRPAEGGSPHPPHDVTPRRHWVDTLGMTSDDRLQIATPPFHILGLLNLLAVVAAGAERAAAPPLRPRGRARPRSSSDRITIEMAVAPIALAMASHPDLERFDLSSLRYIMWGATPVTASVAETSPVAPACGSSRPTAPASCPSSRSTRSTARTSGGSTRSGSPRRRVELRVVDIETGAVRRTGCGRRAAGPQPVADDRLPP